jgi:hypothetical protein
VSRATSAPLRHRPRVARPAATRRARHCATAVLGAIALLMSAPASAAAQSPISSVDRAVVAIPPVYLVPSPGFLRLPETRSVPVGSTASPVLGASGRIGPEDPGGQPAWTPARLEPVVGIDARGHITSILEHTPGRFHR